MNFLEELESIAWLEPWRACSEDGMQSLKNALAREIGPFHPLFKHRKFLIAVGRSDAQDAVLYISDAKPLIAEVHLTWGGRHWLSREWPAVVMYDSVASWIKARMEVDHQELLEE